MPPPAQVTLKRSELYRLVWQEPMTKVAKLYGLSDVGLAKICRKHNIPRPPRGYWAKKEFGHRPKMARLPDPTDDADILLSDPQSCQVRDHELNRTMQETLEAEDHQQAPIAVAPTLRGAHELVAKAHREFEVAKKNDVGLLVRPEGAPLKIHVSKPQLRRALLIADALLKALNQRGYATSSGPTATIFEQPVTFEIVEQLETIRDEPVDHELGGRYEFGHSRFLTKHVPSGRLALQILDAEMHWAIGCRKSWRDAKKQKLENCLNKFVAGLVAFAARKRDHEIEAERERRERAEAAQQREQEALTRAERRKLQQAEQARLNGLLQQASAWRESRRLRSFIAAVRREHMAAGGPIDPESEIGQWLAWATIHADRLDPLEKSPPNILDEVIPEEPKRYSW